MIATGQDDQSTPPNNQSVVGIDPQQPEYPSADLNPSRLEPSTPPRVEWIESDQERILDPEVSEADLAKQLSGTNAFALDLYHRLGRGNADNLFFSPFSISTALAMTWAGARKDTESQMAAAARFLLEQRHLHPVFNYWDLALNSRGGIGHPHFDKGFDLETVNAMWGQRGHPFLRSYIDLLARNYGADLGVVDFELDPRLATELINQWVAEQTRNRIQDLIPAGVLDQATRLVITNIVFFSATWSDRFSKELTYQTDFYLANGEPVAVQMMSKYASFGHLETAGYQAVELPYDGHDLSMLILVPARGTLEELEASLTPSLLSRIRDSMSEGFVQLEMPRWTTRTASLSLVDDLSELGMPLAFSGDADFSGIDGSESLRIDDVRHMGFISVDEDGTEAAAATAVSVPVTSPGPDTLKITLNRPFMYLITDKPTGIILFMGRLKVPAE